MKRARELKLRLGAHNLANVFESNTFTMSVSDVTVHEDWDQSTTRFSHDIALLTTEDAIQFTRYVKPACLLNPEYNVEEFHNGIVPGFGQSEDKMKEHEDLPRELKIPIVSNEKCFLAEPQLALVASLNSFCGGSRQSEGVCQGDLNLVHQLESLHQISIFFQLLRRFWQWDVRRNRWTFPLAGHRFCITFQESLLRCEQLRNLHQRAQAQRVDQKSFESFGTKSFRYFPTGHFQ